MGCCDLFRFLVSAQNEGANNTSRHTIEMSFERF